MRLHQTLEKYLPLISNMLVPAIIFSSGLFAFLSAGEFAHSTDLIFHWGFYVLSFTGLVVLLNFNRGRPLFMMTTVVLSYVLLNYLKHRFGAELKETVWFDNLSFFVPLNLLFFYGVFLKHFFGRSSLFILIALAVEYMLGEIMGRHELRLSFYYDQYNVVSFFLFLILGIWSFTNAVKSGCLFDYATLFSGICVGLGFYYCAMPSGVSIFFFMAQLILLIYLVYTLIYRHYYDELTGVYSRNSYLMQSKHFPLKYSLNIVSIDNYDKLVMSIGQKNVDIVTAMLASLIEEMSADDTVYRYSADEFIIIYKKFDKKEAFNQDETIRRRIAGLEFKYSAKAKPLKLTVSCSVSEKKRSDAGAVEVLMRADKAMRKTLKFSHNVTSQG